MIKGLVTKNRRSNSHSHKFFWHADIKTPSMLHLGKVFRRTKIDTAELERVVHELQAHQIQLKMQHHKPRLPEAGSQERQHEYSDFSPVGDIILDKNGLMLEVNLAAADLLRAPQQTLINKAFCHYLAPEDVPAFVAHRKRTHETRAPQSCEVRVKDRTDVCVQLHTIRVQDAGGTHYRTVLTDISAHKQLERQLRQSQEQLRLTLDGVRDYAVFMLDSDGNIVSWNAGAARILRYTELEILGKPGTIIFTPEDIEAGAPAQELENARRKGSSADARWYARRDGSRFWASGVLTALGDAKRLRGFVKILRDCTEEKQAEEARQALLDQLQLEYARLETVLKQMPGGVIIAEAPSGRILLRNEQVDQLLRQPPPIPTHIEEYKHLHAFRPDGRPLQIEDGPLVRSMLKGEVVCEEDIDYQRGDGSRCTLAVSSGPVRDREHRIVAAVATFFDVTERRRAQVEMLKASKLESIGLLAGGIAHDFNNLLTGILGNITLSRMELNPQDNAYHGLLEAEKACLRARGLTQQLLTFSKGGAPIKHTVPLGPLVKDNAQRVLQGSSARCQFALPDALWLVNVDEGQIGQVIKNLVSNAQEAMPDGGVITITAQNLPAGEREDPSLAPGRYVKLAVADRGMGIPGKDLAKIFDPFYTTKAGGSGLGLTSAYGIVKKHGGDLTVESRNGGGTTFFVYLPAAAQTGDGQ